MKRVYFIKPIGMDGPVKIGCSASPDGRRETLETWAPYPLEIIAEIDGDFQVERRFHAMFASSYRNREWFDWSSEMAATVKQINAGTFDVAKLPCPLDLRTLGPKKTRPHRSPGWCYAHSVKQRIWHLRRAGMPWEEARDLYGIDLEHLHGAALDAIREIVEPHIAHLQRRYKPKAHRRVPQDAAA